MNNGLKIVTKHSFAQVFGEAFYETYTPVAVKKAYAATGIWPLDPSVIKFDRLMPSLPTAAPPPPPPETKTTRKTKNDRITELERKIEELQERVVRLEHPETAPLASIMKYIEHYSGG